MPGLVQRVQGFGGLGFIGDFRTERIRPQVQPLGFELESSRLRVDGLGFRAGRPGSPSVED